ncbi:MAG: RNA-binding protein [Cereibacter sphaeroides]|uniref:RNA-binding protein n=1 Tax=Cereibacter sphaeroides TaxID=1063 RepID=A0A2W5S1H4_CERSP|nr:MAG: RNA-binding protein [Cereibacter sphaeroides]
MSEPRETVRLDKWLWHARFFRTRSLATAEVQAGHVRLNGQRGAKPAHPVEIGDTLTFPQGSRIRVVRITGLGLRRGPATEAQSLYIDLVAPSGGPSPLE